MQRIVLQTLKRRALELPALEARAWNSRFDSSSTDRLMSPMLFRPHFFAFCRYNVRTACLIRPCPMLESRTDAILGLETLSTPKGTPKKQRIKTSRQVAQLDEWKAIPTFPVAFRLQVRVEGYTTFLWIKANVNIHWQRPYQLMKMFTSKRLFNSSLGSTHARENSSRICYYIFDSLFNQKRLYCS